MIDTFISHVCGVVVLNMYTKNHIFFCLDIANFITIITSLTSPLNNTSAHPSLFR